MKTSKHLISMKTKRFFVVPFLVLTFLLVSFMGNDAQDGDDGKFVVVLDAGHGGHDPGNLGNGYLEKNIALNIVLKVGKILEANPDIKVIYTRSDDTFVDLYVRGEIANKANADLFVSVHCDSHTSDAHGAGTFVLGLHANKQNFEIAKKENSVIYLEDNYETRYADYDINSPESVIGLTIMQEEFLDQSISLAKTIQDNFSGKLQRKNREVKQAGFIVLHQTFMPSVLVETGFLTNDDEGAYLNSKTGQSEMGTALAEAILAYKSGIQPNVVAQGEEDQEDKLVEVPIQDTVEILEPKKVLEEEVADAAEQFKNNPGEAPMVEKSVEDKAVLNEPVVEEPVVEKPVVDNSMVEEKIEQIENKVAEVEKVPEKIPDVVEEMPEVVEVEKEVPELPSEQIPVSNEDVIVPEITNVVKKVEEEAKAPAEVVAEVKEEVVESKEVVEPVEKTSAIIFKVQLLASSKSLPLEPGNFNGLNKLSKEPYKNLFRYMYGNASTYKDAKLLKSNADLKGYTTSYIVAYKDGVRIPTPEAIKMASE